MKNFDTKRTVKTLIYVLLLVLPVSACSELWENSVLPNPPRQAEFVSYFESGTTSIERPLNVALDAKGELYIVDGGSSRVLKFNRAGKLVSEWGEPGEGQGQFDFGPGKAEKSALAFGPNGVVYVADSFNNRVQKFDKRGNFEAEWGIEGLEAGQFRDPFGIAVGPDWSVYVSDGLNNNVQKFDRDGNLLAAWGEIGIQPGKFSWPNSIAASQEGRIYVADRSNRRVQVFDRDGGFLFKFGFPGNDDGNFLQPTGIAVDQNGNIYVADVRRGDIQVFDSSGEFQMKWDGAGLDSADGFQPRALVVDKNGRVYIVDNESSLVLVYQLK